MSDIAGLLDKALRSTISYLIFALLGVLGTILVVEYGNLAGLLVYIGALVVVGILFLLLVKYRRVLKVLSSGAKGYYFTFPTSENAKVWRKATRSFKYLGISADSIGLREFIKWMNSLPRSSSLTFFFLLMDPNGTALPLEKAHQKDKAPDAPEVQQEVAADRARIGSSVELLKTTDDYKAGRLRIRLYDEFVPWWMYILDDEEILIGVLPRGGSGLDAPVLVMKRNPKYPSLFDPFMNTWERMWMNARNA